VTGFPWDLLALAVLLAVNRLGAARAVSHRVPYLALQTLDIVAIGVVLALGVPGTDGQPVVKWFVAVVIAFHVVQNFSARAIHVQRLERRPHPRPKGGDEATPRV
jgi:hypothetical protein